MVIWKMNEKMGKNDEKKKADETLYQIKCNCGCIFIPAAIDERFGIEDGARARGWKEKNGKWYCPVCAMCIGDD